jgi:uncharacterized membrane protein YhaH (DUF805 family)
MKEYFNFNGVAKRQEYWAVMILSILAMVVGFVALGAGEVLGALIGLGISVAALWTIFAVTVKRLRDAGLSTWWILTLFVPYVSFVAQIVFGCIESVKIEKDA